VSPAEPPTTGPHFFVEPDEIDAGTAVLRGAEARHLAVVLRARPGDPVSLADGRRLCQAQLTVARDDQARLRVTMVRDIPPSSPRLGVVHALPKGRKLDEVVQRLTELGVDRIAPVHSARSQFRLSDAQAVKAVARWRAVALAAAKQSRRARLPQIDQPAQWADAFPAGTRGVVLWERSTRSLADALDEVGVPTELVLAVGPEGGLAADEVDACGLVDATLGPTVLRTETAALVAASAVVYHLGRFA
jgi:16S rRNA (uracil1498-N3)-methyltransferase